MLCRRRLPIGAEVQSEGTHFRVWAPVHERVEVVLESEHSARSIELDAEGEGYFSKLVPDVTAGARYRYRLSGKDSFPDQASRFQPEGPHRPSQVIDPESFEWT